MKLFGSRLTGEAGPDSDFDVLLYAPELARALVPQPLPHDDPLFYSKKTSACDHHRRKHEWSKALWQRIGGQAAVDKFRENAFAFLKPNYKAVQPELIELFLYLPTDMSLNVWAIRFVWQHDHARLDFACDESQVHWPRHPDLAKRQQEILDSSMPHGEKIESLAVSLREHAGVELSDEYRDYPSLSEIRRHIGRYPQAVAETGLR